MGNRKYVRYRRLISLLFSVSVFAAAAAGQPVLPSGPMTGDEVRFAVLGDPGGSNDGQAVIARQMFAVQQRSPFGLILFLGDNVYNSGSPRDFGREFTLPYRQFIENGTELRGVVGNHDAQGAAEGGVLLQQLMFRMGPRPYYAFSSAGGLVEFFGLDSNAFTRPDRSPAARDQLQWLDAALSRSKAKWKVAFFHHVVYSSAKKHGWNSSDQDEMESVRSALEPLFVKYGVKVVLSGHDHVYERLKPQKGIRYFISGAGSQTRVGNLQTNSPYYDFGNDRELSFMLFSARPDAINYWTINAAGAVIDSGAVR